jgi:hypothetical protein
VPPPPARAAPSGATAAARRGLAGAIAVAKHIYGNEVNGGRVQSDLGFVLRDRVLLSDLSRGRLSAAQQEAHRRMTGNPGLHITRVTVERGGSMVVNAVWNGNGSFVVAPVKRALHVRGRTLGTVLVSVQDVVGYVKLVHVFTGAQVVVRGASGQVRASLAAAGGTPLPSSGYLTIAGQRYIVGSFHLPGWGAELLTVWVLEPA